MDSGPFMAEKLKIIPATAITQPHKIIRFPFILLLYSYSFRCCRLSKCSFPLFAAPWQKSFLTMNLSSCGAKKQIHPILYITQASLFCWNRNLWMEPLKQRKIAISKKHKAISKKHKKHLDKRRTMRYNRYALWERAVRIIYRHWKWSGGNCHNAVLRNPKWTLNRCVGCPWMWHGPQTQKSDNIYGRMAQLVEHIVHIDGVTGSSPVATTTIPGRKAWDSSLSPGYKSCFPHHQHWH